MEKKTAAQKVRDQLKYEMELRGATVSDYLAKNWPDSVRQSIRAVYDAYPSFLTVTLLQRVTGRSSYMINKSILKS